MLNKAKAWYRAMKMEMRENRSTFIVYMILRVAIILVIVGQIIDGDYDSVFLSFLTLLMLQIPSMIQVNFKVELPSTLEIIILFFIFAAQILGEIRSYYIKFPGWDTALHTINGFLMAAIGFSLVDIFNREKNFSIELSPFFQAVVAFCFSMTIGVVWEFFEWGMDILFGLDMQKDVVVRTIDSVLLDPTNSNKVVSIKNIMETTVNGEVLNIQGYLDIGLHDTMKDLLVNFVGAIIFSIIGYLYVKNRGKGKFALRFIPGLKKEDNDFLKRAEKQIEEVEKEKQVKKDD